jgi:F0F1-type ATP synthase membrane subunit b/b'
MKRITINVDLEDNEILNTSIKEAIVSQVTQMSRELFENTAAKEVERLIEARLESWKEKDSWYFSDIRSKVEAATDSSVKNMVNGAVDSFKYGVVSSAKKDAEEKISAELSKLSSEVRNYVDEVLKSINIEKFVLEIIDKKVTAVITDRVLSSLGKDNTPQK